ncbi:cAMP-activated global transcriptional regulator CRP [Anaerolineae bacterium]|nr:cyclic nucleotide-binding domain-containing protein [Anaerolinea sp.]MCC6975668.1 cyclic nucleotide-binding domain-containing protein [Anaerolineae bacterium]CAG0957270.1 cAMP-activated global transcriptional regulator CRP [Anaerolineae bacterium]
MPKILLFQNSDEYELIPAGTHLFDEGDEAEYMYVMVDGELEIHYRGQVVDTLVAGDIVGEMGLIDDAPRSTTAVAKTDVKVVPVSLKRFMFLIEQTPFFALHVMQIMAERLRRMTKIAMD